MTAISTPAPRSASCSAPARILFGESVVPGYRVTSAVTISVMLDHLSNAGIASDNQGLTNVGLRSG